eukprot:1139344-Prorocentrum_minimum.AAC.4
MNNTLDVSVHRRLPRFYTRKSGCVRALGWQHVPLIERWLDLTRLGLLFLEQSASLPLNTLSPVSVYSCPLRAQSTYCFPTPRPLLPTPDAIHSGNTVQVDAVPGVASARLDSLLKAIQCKGKDHSVEAVAEVATPRLKQLLEYCQVIGTGGGVVRALLLSCNKCSGTNGD